MTKYIAVMIQLAFVNVIDMQDNAIYTYIAMILRETDYTIHICEYMSTMCNHTPTYGIV